MLTTASILLYHNRTYCFLTGLLLVSSFQHWSCLYGLGMVLLKCPCVLSPGSSPVASSPLSATICFHFIYQAPSKFIVSSDNDYTVINHIGPGWLPAWDFVACSAPEGLDCSACGIKPSWFEAARKRKLSFMGTSDHGCPRLIANSCFGWQMHVAASCRPLIFFVLSLLGSLGQLVSARDSPLVEVGLVLATVIGGLAISMNRLVSCKPYRYLAYDIYTSTDSM